MWEWGEDFSQGDDTKTDIPKFLLSQDEDLSFMFDDEETTPVKSFGDFPYQFSNGENSDKEPSSQAKRRRMLEFGSEGLDSLGNVGMPSALMKSTVAYKEAEKSKSESQWVSEFADMSASSNENLDQSSERWIAECFNDAEMHISPGNLNSGVSADESSDVQSEFSNKHLESEVNAVPQKLHPVRTQRNIIFKGRKSNIQTPKVTTSVVYPFDFVKPCGAHGDVTLNDINKRIRTPALPKKTEKAVVVYPTSAFSGKPVVGKTKIRTEGGKGSITIMRTKG
ncbi:unnamed protein product [Cuscuta epithymum]|uniref:Protein XRI1 n=1 Tax=Cuscuta epithymum TaxID=186058 RepID=A0AAV0CZ97_9ASTE|nr:unnamed protein product [Cuscuta epithymum]